MCLLKRMHTVFRHYEQWIFQLYCVLWKIDILYRDIDIFIYLFFSNPTSDRYSILFYLYYLLGESTVHQETLKLGNQSRKMSIADVGIVMQNSTLVQIRIQNKLTIDSMELQVRTVIDHFITLRPHWTFVFKRLFFLLVLYLQINSGCVIFSFHMSNL